MVVEYKLDIIDRLGGQATFDLTIVALAQRIRMDPELRDFFRAYLLEDVILEQNQFFTAVFAKHPDTFNLYNFVLLRHYALILQGFTERHFDLLVRHFARELQDSWVNNVAIQDAVSLMNQVRPVFDSSSTSSLSSCSSTVPDDMTWVSSERSTPSQHRVLEQGKKSSSAHAGPCEKSRRGILNLIRGTGIKRTKKPVTE